MLMEYLETCPPQPGDRIVFSGPAPGIRLCDCDFAAGGPFAPGRLGEGRFEAVFWRPAGASRWGRGRCCSSPAGRG